MSHNLFVTWDECEDTLFDLITLTQQRVMVLLADIGGQWENPAQQEDKCRVSGHTPPLSPCCVPITVPVDADGGGVLPPRSHCPLTTTLG